MASLCAAAVRGDEQGSVRLRTEADGPPVVVNLDDNTATFPGGAVVAMVPQQADALFVLARSWPKAALVGEIAEGLWGAEERWPDACGRNIVKLISGLRRLLAEHGVGILGQGHGYRLIPVDPGAKRRQRERRVWTPEKLHRLESMLTEGWRKTDAGGALGMSFDAIDRAVRYHLPHLHNARKKAPAA